MGTDEDQPDMPMPYGKFAGKLLCDIPSNYLKWVAGHFDDDKIATAADKEWFFREKNGTHFE